LREEALERLSSLTELTLHSTGGRSEAERQRLWISRSGASDEANPQGNAPVMGLNVEGNFLFDPVEPDDIRAALFALGVAEAEIGDIWIRGDRGAQALCTPEAADHLDGQKGHVRDVDIHIEQKEVEQLQLPATRIPKQLTSVEASCRLDAIASAGFGLSRAKVVQQVRNGRLRLNWKAVRQASKDLNVGDRLQLQDRGSLEVLALERTKRERWRVRLERR
jgi:photosystem II S4 domain protein